MKQAKVVVVTGVAGQLGHDIIKALALAGIRCFGTDKDTVISLESGHNVRLPYCSMDFTNLAETERILESVRASYVIHCGSFSDIDDAESKANNSKVKKENVEGTRNIALTCKKLGATMIYISSSQVYSGDNDIEHPVTEELKPLNNYGKSKLLAEEAIREVLPSHFILRCSWIYGAAGDNFVSKILKAAEKQKDIMVVDDEISTPTYAKDLAEFITELIETDCKAYGCYNVSNGNGPISRVRFAEEICKRAGLDVNIVPVSSADYVSKEHTVMAKRPKRINMSMDENKELKIKKMPPWYGALGRFLKDIKYPVRNRK